MTGLDNRQRVTYSRCMRTTDGRITWDSRPARESLRKRMGARVARAIEARDGGRCAYCGCTAAESGAHLHLDHLVVRSRGGADDPRNLVTACRRCNSARQAMSLTQWSRYAAAVYGLAVDPRAVRRQAARITRYLEAA